MYFKSPTTNHFEVIISTFLDNFPPEERIFFDIDSLHKYISDLIVEIQIIESENDEFVGCYILEHLECKDNAILNLLSYIWIDKKYQGKGLGSKIMNKLKSDLPNLYLECNDKNVGFYKKLGFEKAINNYLVPNLDKNGDVKYDENGQFTSRPYNLMFYGEKVSSHPEIIIYEKGYEIDLRKSKY